MHSLQNVIASDCRNILPICLCRLGCTLREVLRNEKPHVGKGMAANSDINFHISQIQNVRAICSSNSEPWSSVQKLLPPGCQAFAEVWFSECWNFCSSVYQTLCLPSIQKHLNLRILPNNLVGQLFSSVSAYISSSHGQTQIHGRSQFPDWVEVLSAFSCALLGPGQGQSATMWSVFCSRNRLPPHLCSTSISLLCSPRGTFTSRISAPWWWILQFQSFHHLTRLLICTCCCFSISSISLMLTWTFELSAVFVCWMVELVFGVFFLVPKVSPSSPNHCMALSWSSQNSKSGDWTFKLHNSRCRKSSLTPWVNLPFNMEVPPKFLSLFTMLLCNFNNSRLYSSTDSPAFRLRFQKASCNVLTESACPNTAWIISKMDSGDLDLPSILNFTSAFAAPPRCWKITPPSPHHSCEKPPSDVWHHRFIHRLQCHHSFPWVWEFLTHPWQHILHGPFVSVPVLPLFVFPTPVLSGQAPVEPPAVNSCNLAICSFSSAAMFVCPESGSPLGWQ